MKSLSNLKILDFTTLLPGPYATMMLADMGAEVLRIASPDKPDLVLDNKNHHDWLCRGKKEMFLNLKEQEAVNKVKELVKTYDIVIEQFRPGVMAKLGLDYETLKQINPRLIYCSLTGYGQTGPMKDRAGHDINYLSRSGLMDYSGRKETGPVLTGMQIADLASGSMNSIIGILAAVNYRNITGEGQYIDIAMTDGVLSFNAMVANNLLSTGKETKREEDWLNGGGIYDFYKTKDDRYLSIGSLEPKFYKALCETLKLPNPTKEDIKQEILKKNLSEWEEIFSQTDACVEPVLTLKEALSDSQTISRGMIKDNQIQCPIKLK